jgi:hypothetical protein
MLPDAYKYLDLWNKNRGCHKIKRQILHIVIVVNFIIVIIIVTSSSSS